MDKLEILARMWMECDPNRQGSNPDEIMHFDEGYKGDYEGQPRWKWFLPRAEESLKYLQDKGLLKDA